MATKTPSELNVCQNAWFGRSLPLEARHESEPSVWMQNERLRWAEEEGSGSHMFVVPRSTWTSWIVVLGRSAKKLKRGVRAVLEMRNELCLHAGQIGKQRGDRNFSHYSKPGT
jgi:hypothetical protein